jgi:hypothetical protein
VFAQIGVGMMETVDHPALRDAAGSGRVKMVVPVRFWQRRPVLPRGPAAAGADICAAKATDARTPHRACATDGVAQVGPAPQHRLTGFVAEGWLGIPCPVKEI